MIKLYKVNIRETLEREINVVAESEEEAIEFARDKYNREEIVLSAEDYTSTDIYVKQSKH